MHLPLSSTLRGHTLIALGEIRQTGVQTGTSNGSPLSSLCSFLSGPAGLDDRSNRCDTCLLMEQVFIANVPDAWDRRIPYFKAGLLTLCSRYFVLSVLKRVEDSPRFARWQAAKTFEYLQHHIALMPKIAVDLSDPTAACFPCCHYCGAEAKEAFPGSTCCVCESSVLTRPSAPIGVMKPLNVR
jgi:hypothetical protein